MLKCPYCIETQPSRSWLQTHIDGVHRHADTRENRRAAALNARTVENVVPDLDVPTIASRLLAVGEELAALKAAADDVAQRLEALDANDMERVAENAARTRFHNRVKELGGIVLELDWLGGRTPHRVLCPKGHESTIQPTTVLQGLGMCNKCGHLDRQRSRMMAAQQRFEDAVAEQGGEVLTADWLGTLMPHPVRCRNGHETAVKPKRVLQGRGLCDTCTWTKQDVVYVVFNDELGRVKLGITSGDPKPRLGAHATDGYRRVLLVRTGLDDSVARDVETETLRQMKADGASPVQGREYFEGAWSSAILDNVMRMLGQPEGDWS